MALSSISFPSNAFVAKPIRLQVSEIVDFNLQLELSQSQTLVEVPSP